MIYDLFMFFNELDLLELRLNELKDRVDKHVLVEARQTHQLKSKPLYYKENKERFAEFEHKIIHLVIDSFPPEIGLGYQVADYTRYRMIDALSGCSPNDVILLSDADEIPRETKVLEVVKKIKSRDKFTLIQPTYGYWLNGFRFYRWMGTTIVTYGCLMEHFDGRLDKLRKARVKRSSGFIHQGGWHFSFLGGVDSVIAKLQAYTDTEWVTEETMNRDRIEQCIENLESCTQKGDLVIVPMDSTYPRYVLQNQDKFARFIKHYGRR